MKTVISDVHDVVMPTRRVGATERECLELLFRELDAAAVPYCVMRNYESLPQTAGGSDLDLLVPRHCGANVGAVIDRVVARTNTAVVGSYRSAEFLKVFLLGCGTDGWWGLRLDVNLGVGFKGLSYIADDQVESLTQLHRGVRVLRSDVAAVLGVVKELLNHGRLSERYRVVAKATTERGWLDIQTVLTPFGAVAVEALKEAIVSGDGGSQAARQLRRRLHSRGVFERPWRYVSRRTSHEFSKLRRWLVPPGAMIAVLGVDGVGKSTVIAAIEPALQAATHGALRISHLRPALLPPLARLKGATGNATAIPVLDPHGATPSGAIGSLVRLAYYTADYVAGYWLKVRPAIAREPTVWLFDRYSYDMAIDPRRFRISLPPAVTRVLVRATPKPDLILCLHADPDVIAARKQELPSEEIYRQVRAIRGFAAREPRAVLISTEGTPTEVRDRVLETVRVFFARRAAGQRVGVT